MGNPLYLVQTPFPMQRYMLAALLEHLAITGLNVDMNADFVAAARHYELPSTFVQMLETAPRFQKNYGGSFVRYLKLLAEQAEYYHMDRFKWELPRVRRNLAPWLRLEQLLAIAQTALIRMTVSAELWGSQTFMTQAVNPDWCEDGDLPYGAAVYHNVAVEVIYNYEDDEYTIDLLPDGADPEFTSEPTVDNLFYELWGDPYDDGLAQRRARLEISEDALSNITGLLRREFGAKPDEWRERVLTDYYRIITANIESGVFVYRRGDTVTAYAEQLQAQVDALSEDELLVADFTDIDYDAGDISYSVAKFQTKLGAADGLDALYRHVGLPHIADFLNEHPAISLTGLLELTLYGSQGVTTDVRAESAPSDGQPSA